MKFLKFKEHIVNLGHIQWISLVFLLMTLSVEFVCRNNICVRDAFVCFKPENEMGVQQLC